LNKTEYNQTKEPITKLHFCHGFVGSLNDFAVSKCFRRSSATQKALRGDKRRTDTKAGKIVLQLAQSRLISDLTTGILLSNF